MALVLRTPSHRFWRIQGNPQSRSSLPLRTQRDSSEIWEPRVTVSKGDGRLKYAIEVDGTNPEDLNVSISEDAIMIKGVRRRERKIERRGYALREISRSSFSRRLSLPRSVDWEKAEATFEYGILEVSMAVTVETPKHIKIRPGEQNRESVQQ